MPKGKIVLLGNDPGDINDLLVPMARVLHVPQNPQLMMRQLRNSLDDLPYILGGRAAKPNAPLMLRNVDGSTTILPGFGVTEAAELQDLAYAQLEKKRDDWRERYGFPDRASFDARLREHMDERVKHPENRGQAMSASERSRRRASIPVVNQ